MLDDNAIHEAMTKYALYQNAVDRGAKIQVMLLADKVEYNDLTDANILDVRTNQFEKRWLSQYKMSDISWIKRQFEERGKS